MKEEVARKQADASNTEWSDFRLIANCGLALL